MYGHCPPIKGHNKIISQIVQTLVHMFIGLLLIYNACQCNQTTLFQKILRIFYLLWPTICLIVGSVLSLRPLQLGLPFVFIRPRVITQFPPLAGG